MGPILTLVYHLYLIWDMNHFLYEIESILPLSQTTEYDHLFQELFQQLTEGDPSLLEDEDEEEFDKKESPEDALDTEAVGEDDGYVPDVVDEVVVDFDALEDALEKVESILDTVDDGQKTPSEGQKTPSTAQSKLSVKSTSKSTTQQHVRAHGAGTHRTPTRFPNQPRPHSLSVPPSTAPPQKSM